MNHIPQALSLATKIAALEVENDRLHAALELIACPKRPDGTYNRGREACEQIAREALTGPEIPFRACIECGHPVRDLTVRDPSQPWSFIEACSGRPQYCQPCFDALPDEGTDVE